MVSPENMAPTSQDQKRKMMAFKIIAILLPFVMLGLLEVVLRIAGFGHDLQLFVEDTKHPDFLVMNQHASKKYFTETENATIGNFERFKKVKDAHTYRIFVLGESTTIGYPYLHNGSFHRWLQYRLMHAYPAQNFEVINLSLTAVNSYTVQDFAKQIVPYEPDAVLMYVGHNEYYGALGVGSTSFSGSNPGLIRGLLGLKSVRIVQLIGKVMAASRRLISNENQEPDLRENLMKRMASEQQIPIASGVYEAGIHQFESNLQVALTALADHQIPVLISNLVSNEKDLNPFISDTTNQENSAKHHFQLGGKAYNAGNFKEAKKQFLQAKELDLLRFRAPEAMNKIIEKQASQFPNVTLVDTKNLFESHSPHQILGQETLLEHVHPNLYGYALLSEAFYQSLRQQKVLPEEPRAEMTFEELYQQMPITLVDSLKGAYEIMILKEGWPFNEPIAEDLNVRNSFESELAGGLSVKQISWNKAMQQLYKHYLEEKDLEKAFQVAEAMVLENPYEADCYKQAGKLSMNLQNDTETVFYLEKAFQLQPDFATAKDLFITLLKMDKPRESLQFLNYAADHQPDNMSLSELKLFVNQIIALKEKYSQNPSDVALTNQIAAAYLKFANTAAASIYIEKSLQLAHNNPMALAMQQQIQQLKN